MSASGTTYGDRYTIFERVGAGGMAEVYRARDELLGRDVAVKVLSERFARDGSFVERFRREAQSAANLNHPQIVSLYDYGSDGDAYFIVMEFIDGTSLADVIRNEAPLLPERAAEIALDVTKALDRAHTAGIVHRDIKPGNILLTKDGHTKVTDFGIARAAHGDNEQTMTQTGMVIGTAAYLSPEQAQGEPVDGRSDLYSLGVVLYEMLAGHAPFAGDTPLAIAYKHVREFAAPPSSMNPDVPAELDAVVMKALAKNPENRYQNAVEFEQDLQRFLSGQHVHATPLMNDETQIGGAVPVTATQVLRPDTATTRAVPPPERSRTGWYLLAALGILLLFGLAAWLLFNNLVGESPAPKVMVPNVVGKDVGAAKTILENHHLKAVVHRQRSDRPPGQVLTQDPVAGDHVAARLRGHPHGVGRAGPNGGSGPNRHEARCRQESAQNESPDIGNADAPGERHGSFERGHKSEPTTRSQGRAGIAGERHRVVRSGDHLGALSGRKDSGRCSQHPSRRRLARLDQSTT